MYASDYAYWVLAALAIGRPREVYNVGSPEPVDLETLARMITRIFSPEPEIRLRVGQSGHDRSRLIPNVSRAARDLGVEITVPLGVAIQRSITWNRLLLSK
jgi:dTDP-glucose 4,6-dehydratase